MGARVVFEALLTLAHEGGTVGRGIVEHAVLIGAPVGFGIGFASGLDGLMGHEAAWASVRQVVSGRLVNCYSTRDWMLALLYRQKSLDLGVAGLQPVVLQRGNHTLASTSPSLSHNKTNVKSVGDSDDFEEGGERAGCGTQSQARAERHALAATLAQFDEVENIDVSALVGTQLDIPQALPLILSLVKVGGM